MASIPDYQQILRTSFASRLISRLRDMGFISRRGTNGVNGQKLADAIGVSLPMARRYINGQSLPENSTLHKISTWLNVDPCWLLYGDSQTTCSTPQTVDVNLLKEIFSQMFPILSNPNLTKEQYLSLVTASLEIYCNIASMDTETKSKNTAVALMVDFLRKNM